jgi:hypothetical protein
MTELKPVTLTIGGRPVVVEPSGSANGWARDLYIDWSRWNFDHVRLASAMVRMAERFRAKKPPEVIW